MYYSAAFTANSTYQRIIDYAQAAIYSLKAQTALGGVVAPSGVDSNTTSPNVVYLSGIRCMINSQ